MVEEEREACWVQAQGSDCLDSGLPNLQAVTLTLSEPHLPHLQNGDMNIISTRALLPRAPSSWVL